MQLNRRSHDTRRVNDRRLSMALKYSITGSFLDPTNAREAQKILERWVQVLKLKLSKGGTSQTNFFSLKNIFRMEKKFEKSCILHLDL